MMPFDVSLFCESDKKLSSCIVPSESTMRMIHDDDIDDSLQCSHYLRELEPGKLDELISWSVQSRPGSVKINRAGRKNKKTPALYDKSLRHITTMCDFYDMSQHAVCKRTCGSNQHIPSGFASLELN